MIKVCHFFILNCEKLHILNFDRVHEHNFEAIFEMKIKRSYSVFVNFFNLV